MPESEMLRSHSQESDRNELLLPKVSILILNYNYGCHLEKAVGSIYAQTYPNIEIIIVDDKSTDDSLDTIDRICCEYRNEAERQISAVKLPANVGQTMAGLHGLAASSGAYVVFFDADDEILPRCIEAHVYAHLSSRIPVAFTSVDNLNTMGEQDVNTTSRGFSDYVESRKGCRVSAFRAIDKSVPGSWFGCRAPVVDLKDLHLVLPPHADPWIWSPTSANCFRRDAVRLLLSDPNLSTGRWGIDMFLMPPLSALFGSLLIDAPLMRYVTHGTNNFTKAAPLQNLLTFDTSAACEEARDLTTVAINHLMTSAAENGPRYSSPDVFFAAMHALCDSWGMQSTDGDIYLDLLLANRDALTRGFGEPVVSRELAKRRRRSLMQIKSAMKRLIGHFGS